MLSDARAEALAALSRFVVTDATVGDTLQQISSITLTAIPSAAFLGMTMLDDAGRATTAIFTDDESPQIDRAQYESGKGPCLEAWRTKEIVRIDDMDKADVVYPEFAAAARSHGVQSTLSLPLVAGGHGLGALNLYARIAQAFTADDEEVGRDLAAAASVVLANVSAYWTAVELSQQLSEAMQTRAVIEQAKGILMAETSGLDPDGAFDLLRQASQRENVKLREVARRIVEQRLAAD